MNKLPEIKKDDILYTYKEPIFSGFAPCFDDGIYSLACCKGQMRRTKKFRENGEAGNVWILSVAGTAIGKNDMTHSFSGGDMICLVRVEKLLNWKDYSEQYSDRKDAIYKYENNQMVLQDNKYHTDKSAIYRDCGKDKTGKDNKYPDIKQVVLSKEYYIFKPGHKIGELQDFPNVPRNFTYQGNIEKVVDFMKKNPDSYEYRHIFDDTEKKAFGDCSGKKTTCDCSGK